MTESARLVIAVDSRQVGQAQSALDSLGRASSLVSKAVSAVGPALGVRELYQATEAYSSIANRMRLVTESAVELRAAQEAVFQSAQTARQPLAATAELYQRIAANQKALHLSGKGVAGITDTISKSLAISGASAASANAALIQLGQAFASGTLRGEELNSVMEQAPALSQAIAAGMGVTVGQLRTLGAEGKLTAEAVVKALQDQADAVDEKFNRIANTVGGALQVASNTLTRFVGELDQASGATSTLAGGIIGASKFVDKFTEGSEALSTSLTAVGTAMTVAAGRVVGGYAQQGAAALYAANANRVALNAAAATAKQDLWAAQAKQIDAKATLEHMTLQLRAAEGQVASDRAVMASELSRIKSVQTALAAEMALEQQRMKSQISEAGRNATVARMVEIRGSQIAIDKQVEAAERSLAATTVATSAQVQAAYEKVAVAKAGVGETTAAVNAASAASDRATAAASTFAGAGRAVLGLLGGPLGLVFTVGVVAASYFMFRDGANEATSALIDQNGTLDDSIQKFKDLSAEQQRFQSSKWVEAQESALDSAASSLAEYASRGSQAFNSLGMSGVESAEAFSKMVAEVKAGTRSLDSVTEWVSKNNQIMPSFRSMLEQTAAAYSASGEKADKYGKLLAQSSGVTSSATTETEKLAAAQAAASKSNGASAGDWDKYIAKLTETRDLLGANAAAEAEYNAAKMGANAQQVAQAKLIGDQTDTLKKYQDAIKEGDKVQQASLKLQLVALYTAEDAATQAAATQSKAYADTATAAENSARRQITAVEQAANFAVASATRVAMGASGPQANLSGYGLLTNGGAAPAAPVVQKATPDQRAQAAIDQLNATTDANKRVDKAANAAATALKNQQKALEDLLATSAISTKSSNDMADAYLAGADSVRELAIQQKIEEELLKTGAGARDAVTKAMHALQDAKDREDVSQYTANLRMENANTVAQAAATLQGKDALESFNITKAMTIALSGKKIATDSVEYKQLLEQTKAQLAANKALEQANSIEGIVDRLNPQVKLLRDYTKDQEALNAAIASGAGDTALYQDTLAKLALEYEQNKNAATAWGQFTEGVVDRVDSAFADAWKNIDDGFSGFATSLKDGFKQLLAELAHMAITKPIIMQIGASLGVGGLSAQSSGLFGGSSGGGSSLDTMFSAGKSIYSAASSGFGSAVSAGWSAGEGFLGGMQGAISNGSTYVSNGLSGLFSSGAASAVSNTASSLASGASAAGYTEAEMSSWVTGQNYAAGNYGYAGPVMAGVGGAIAGYQQAGLKGGVTGAAGAVGGFYGGAALGTMILPGIGTIIGAALGSILGGKVGASIWGGDWQTKDQGLSLGVENGDFAGQQFEYQKKKGGLFSSNKKRTRLSALDPQMQAALDATYDATEGSVLSLFDRLNVQLNDGVLDGLNIAASQISTKDKTAEQIQAEITKWFGGVADFMTVAVANATGSGTAGYDFEALTEFVNNLYGVNDVIKHLNVGLFDMSVTGGFMAEQLSAWAGGFEALKTSAATYYDGFFTDAEKSANTLSDVRKEFENLGITLPETRQGYRDMVEGIDRTTEAGRAMFVTLLGLSGDAAQAFTILEANANSASQVLAEALNGAVTGAMGAVRRAVSAEKDAATKAYNDRVNSLNDMVSTATANVSGLTAVGNDLSAALKALRGDSDDAVKMLRAQAQATLQSALATARSGGSLSGITGLSDALDTVSSNNTDLYSSMEDFARDQGRTANVVAELNALNGKQLTTEEQLLASVKDQVKLAKDQFDEEMAKLDQQLDLAQAQIDALNGVDNSVLSVAGAMSGLSAAITAALAAKPAGSAAANTSANNSMLLDTVYQSVLGREADAAGAAYWGGLLQSGMEYADLVAAITKDATANGELKKYATGGLITGPGTGTSDSIFARLSNGEYVMNADAVRMFGTGLLDQMNAGQLPAFAMGGGVGETGPQLEVTGPSRIFNANQAGTMGSGGSDFAAILSELKQTRAENKEQRFQIAKANKQVAALLQKWDAEGAPKERDYAL